MPYPNEHAARLRDPGDFQPDSFRRKQIADGITLILGRLKGETTMTGQAYRFKADKFTAAEAKAWLKDHDIKFISFEEATGEEKSAMEGMLRIGGSPVKYLGDGKVGGHLVLFSNARMPDLTGEFFTAQTDFGLEDGMRTPIYFDHGFDPVLGRRKLGRGEMRTDADVGVWVEGVLEQRDEYERMLLELSEAGKFGWSSGTAGHLVEYEPKSRGVRWIKTWPLGLDASLTPTPAEPRTQVQTLKAYAETSNALRQLLEGAGNAPTQTGWTDEEWAEVKRIVARSITRHFQGA